MKISTKLNWICRKDGGIFLGVRFRFPSEGYYDEYRYTSSHLRFGFLVFSLDIYFQWNVRGGEVLL